MGSKQEQNLYEKYPIFGADLGRFKNEWNPLYSSYTQGTVNDLVSIDTKETEKNLTQIFRLLFQVLQQNGHIWIVNTNPYFLSLMKKTKRLSQRMTQDSSGARLNASTPISWVDQKWIGGLLTNCDQMMSSVESYRESLEVIGMSRGAQTMLKSLSPLMSLPQWKKRKKYFSQIYDKPDLIIFLNVDQHSLAIKEAISMNVPIIAFMDSNCEKSTIEKVTYPIPVNVHSIYFIHFFLNILLKLQFVSGMNSK